MQFEKNTTLKVSAVDDFSPTLDRYREKMQHATGTIDSQSSAVTKGQSAFSGLTGSLGLYGLSLGIVSGATIGMARNLICLSVVNRKMLSLPLV